MAKNNFIVSFIFLISKFSNYAIVFILAASLLNLVFSVFDDYKTFYFIALILISVLLVINSITLKIEEMEGFYIPIFGKVWTVFIYPIISIVSIAVLIANNFILNLYYHNVFNVIAVLSLFVCFCIESYIFTTFCDERLDHYIQKRKK